MSAQTLSDHKGQSNEPQHARAAEQEATSVMAAASMGGRTCPYCRSMLEEGEQVTRCPACDATHHADCWAENGGCAVPLCEGGPEDGAAPPQAAAPSSESEAPTAVVPADPPAPPAPAPPPSLPTVAAPPAAPPPAPPAGAKAPPPPPNDPMPRSRGVGFLPVLAGVIILLGGGTAAAIVLTQKSDSGSSTAAVDAETASASSSTEEGSEPFEPETTGETEAVYEPTPPERVEQALHAHFGRLVADNYSGAYDDLSPSEGEAIGGEEVWTAAQREDELEHFELSVDVSMHGPHAATADIVSFSTHAYASGCHTWTGSWELVKQYGRWLIDAADLERGSC